MLSQEGEVDGMVSSLSGFGVDLRIIDIRIQEIIYRDKPYRVRFDLSLRHSQDSFR